MSLRINLLHCPSILQHILNVLWWPVCVPQPKVKYWLSNLGKNFRHFCNCSAETNFLSVLTRSCCFIKRETLCLRKCYVLHLSLHQKKSFEHRIWLLLFYSYTHNDFPFLNVYFSFSCHLYIGCFSELQYCNVVCCETPFDLYCVILVFIYLRKNIHCLTKKIKLLFGFKYAKILWLNC